MLKVLSLFSGIGAFEKALQRINFTYELIGYSEIDRWASKSYSLIHNKNEELNLGDITKVNETELQDFDLMTWGFPCTDISTAGKQKGFIDEEGNKTRSGLYYEGLRILQCKKPKYSIIENVKALTQKKFKNDFDQILKDLDDAGYNNYWKVLNAKDFGVPQNRERIFIISIRKDVDNKTFEFPEEFDNGIRLKDILENEVDEKYYISQEKTNKLINQLLNKEKILNNDNSLNIVGNVGNTGHHGLDVYSENGICPTLKARDFKDPVRILQLGMLDIRGNEQVRRVYSSDGLSPTLNTMSGGNRQPKILEENKLRFIGGIDVTDKWIENEKDLSRNYKEGYRVYDSKGIACCQKSNGGGIGSHTGLYLENQKFVQDKYNEFIKENGYIPSMFNPYNKTEINDIAPTQTTQCGSTTSSATVLIHELYRIRKLTPKECLRLMGFDDEDYYILKENEISDTQLYKMAGNSIVVNVLEEIFNNLLIK